MNSAWLWPLRVNGAQRPPDRLRQRPPRSGRYPELVFAYAGAAVRLGQGTSAYLGADSKAVADGNWSASRLDVGRVGRQYAQW